MKELLERVAKCMPEGWRLIRGQYRWNLYNYPDVTNPRPDDFPGGFTYDDWLDDSHGDIGLAPLTALLKQGLPNPLCIDRGEYGFAMADERDRSGLLYKTEFECVAHDWLALKENKCN